MVKKQEQKQLRVFGFGLPLFCLVVAWRQYAKHGFTGWVEGLLMAAAAVLVMAVFIPPWLKVVFNAWMKVAELIGVVMTTLILTLFFFGVVTPASIILRLLGRDFMDLRDKGQQESYWIQRENKKEDYTQQF